MRLPQRNSSINMKTVLFICISAVLACGILATTELDEDNVTTSTDFVYADELNDTRAESSTEENDINETTTIDLATTIDYDIVSSSTANIDSDESAEDNDVDDGDENDEPQTTQSTSHRTLKCKDGFLLSAWQPLTNITVGDQVARGLFYFLCLCYLFLGVSIASDSFMAAIEKITAIEKEVSVRQPDGTKRKVVVRVWNETVANLTLMALGTSAPEILLSIIEVFTTHYQAGDLGPGTIVGSAAYNLFTIMALCVVVIPTGEVRRIKHLRVFFVTCSWSIFAYIWLYWILAVSSPGEVTVTEGLITFSFFPAIVLMAYAADRRLYKYLRKDYRLNARGVMVETEAIDPIDFQPTKRSDSLKMDDGTELFSNEYKDIDQLRQEYVAILQDLRQKYPQHDRETLEMLAQEQLLNDGPKSRAFYRIQATRKILGGGNVIRRIAERTTNEVKSDLVQVETIDENDYEAPPSIIFEPAKYTVMENCGSVDIRIVRKGAFSGHASCDYATKDGSAEAMADYIPQSGKIVFTPGINERFIKIDIIDDDVFEQDEAFYVELSNPSEGASLGSDKVATVLILDDDHNGFFSIESDYHEMAETVGVYELKVIRSSGARGRVAVPYWTEDGR